LDVSPGKDFLFSGGGEGEVKAWRIDKEAVQEGLKANDAGEVCSYSHETSLDSTDVAQVVKMIHPITNLPLGSQHRVTQIAFHPKQPYIAFQSHERSIEIFRIRSDEEVKKKMARRRKRAKEKKLEQAGKKGKLEEADADVEMEEEEIPFIDKFAPHVVVRASGKVRSFDFAIEPPSQKSIIQLFVALSNNSMEVYSIPQPAKSSDAPPEATRTHSVHLPGHRADIRSLCLSSDDRILASAANGSLKIWNMKTTACIRTMECPHPVSSTFLPGDRHVRIQLYQQLRINHSLNAYRSLLGQRPAKF